VTQSCWTRSYHGTLMFKVPSMNQWAFVGVGALLTMPDTETLRAREEGRGRNRLPHPVTHLPPPEPSPICVTPVPRVVCRNSVAAKLRSGSLVVSDYVACKHVLLVFTVSFILHLSFFIHSLQSGARCFLASVANRVKCRQSRPRHHYTGAWCSQRANRARLFYSTR
jgi:hypothetical protein